MDDVRYCAKCEAEIPKARIAALPDTILCIACSEEVGGDHELEVSISSTSKAGSLKKTGEEISVKRKKRDFR